MQQIDNARSITPIVAGAAPARSNSAYASESGQTLTRGGVIARIESLPGNAMKLRARMLIGTATFFDGFDVITIATTLPLLIHKWGLHPAQIAFLIACGSIGQLLGAFLFPALSERYGRVRAIAWSSGIIGVTSVACGFAPSFAAFVVFRILQGIGLGGELPVAATYINEITKAHGRGRFVLLYEIVFPIGLLGSNALGAYLVPRFGWEVMYWIGGAPLLLYFVLRRLVPESPRWLADKQRFAEAEQALRRFESTVKGELPSPAPAAVFDAVAQHPVRRKWDVVSRAYLKRTIAVALLWGTCGVIQYGLVTWLPVIYQKTYHAPLQLALNLAIGASLLSVVGSLVCAMLVDRVGRKPIIIVSFALCTVTLLLAGVLHAQSLIVVAILCSLCMGFTGTGFITAYVYTPELYPTSIRAFGCGLGSAWLKVASLFAPGLVAKAMGAGHLEIAFYALAAFPFIAALAVHYLSIETKETVLEALEA